jgi:hypothetical protein
LPVTAIWMLSNRSPAGRRHLGPGEDLDRRRRELLYQPVAGTDSFTTADTGVADRDRLEHQDGPAHLSTPPVMAISRRVLDAT